VDVNEDVASRLELNDCDAVDACVELVEDAPEAESWVAEGLAGVVVAGAAEFSVVDGVGASTTWVEKVLPVESTSICWR